MERLLGRGPPHTDALLRLFDAEDESHVRVTLYRDDAAWCPYCQKTWLLLEEKRIPYRVKKVPMNAYGDKPAWFTRMVDGGILPVLELDGTLYTESLNIMKLLDVTFAENLPIMMPSTGTLEAAMANSFLELERRLQSKWFSLTFYPVQGDALARTREQFLDTLREVDEALGATPGPWFLGGDAPSLVDLQYVSHMERIVASVLHWKGLSVRGRFENLDCWLASFEERPAYLASKSDYYTLSMAIPSQNGPGYFVDDAKDISYQICGLGGAWELPLENRTEPLAPAFGDDESARHEAAYKLICNFRNVINFACRGAGEPGRPSFHAELADPYAEPNEDFFVPVDVCLRHVTAALLDGIDDAALAAKGDLSGKNVGNDELQPNWEAYKDDDGRIYFWNEASGQVTWTPPTRQLDSCLAYLRDRIGVPRDMGQSAALQLRAHLNWVIALLR
jgi:glutathione S-transferase